MSTFSSVRQRSNVKSDVRDHVRDHVRSDGRDGEPSILHFPFIYAGFRRSMVGMLGLLRISFSDTGTHP